MLLHFPTNRSEFIRTGTETVSPLTNFADLGLSQKVLSDSYSMRLHDIDTDSGWCHPPALQRRDILA